MGTGGVRSARRSECMRTRSKEKPPSALRESPGREGVPMPRYIGLDVHKRYVHACEFRPDRPEGQQERHFRFPNTPEACTALVAELDREAVVALEVTGNAFEIYDTLAPDAGTVLVADAIVSSQLGWGRPHVRRQCVRPRRFPVMVAGAEPPSRVGFVRRPLTARLRTGCLTPSPARTLRCSLQPTGLRQLAGWSAPEGPSPTDDSHAVQPKLERSSAAIRPCSSRGPPSLPGATSSSGPGPVPTVAGPATPAIRRWLAGPSNAPSRRLPRWSSTWF